MQCSEGPGGTVNSTYILLLLTATCASCLWYLAKYHKHEAHVAVSNNNIYVLFTVPPGPSEHCMMWSISHSNLRRAKLLMMLSRGGTIIIHSCNEYCYSSKAPDF